MSDLARALRIILSDEIEGGFTKDPDDPGNWTGGNVGVGELRGTKYGISAAQFPSLAIENLEIDQVVPIYEEKYWRVMHCDKLKWPLNFFVLDAAINQGVKAATQMIQRVCRVPDDGVIGPVTLKAMVAAGEWEATKFLTTRAIRYLATRNFDKFGRGWLNRLFTIAQAAHKP